LRKTRISDKGNIRAYSSPKTEKEGKGGDFEKSDKIST
jgi:hypothetical protein